VRGFFRHAGCSREGIPARNRAAVDCDLEELSAEHFLLVKRSGSNRLERPDVNAAEPLAEKVGELNPRVLVAVILVQGGSASSPRGRQKNLAAFAKQPMRFAHDSVWRVDVLNHVGHHHAVECLIRERQRAGVGTHQQRASMSGPAIELGSRELQWQERIINSAYRLGSPGKAIRERSIAASNVKHAPGARIHGIEQDPIPCREDRVVPGRQSLDFAPVIRAESLVFSERAFRAFAQRPFLMACS
jgi:hypothetical protein